MSLARIKGTCLVLMTFLVWVHTTVQAEWLRDGVPICSSSGDQWYGYVAPDGAGGAFIVWDEIRSGIPYDSDIFVQRVDKDGNTLWNPEGVPICTLPGAQEDPAIIQDGAVGVIIAWRDQRDQYFRVYA